MSHQQRRLVFGFFHTSIAWRRAACALLWTVAIGCQSPLGWKNPFARSDDERSEVASGPHKVVALWTHTVMNRPGKQPQRGLGGRLYFYDGEHNAVPVDGKLVVYAYDDVDSHSSQKTPDRKYIFEADTFTGHESESDLGPSYSVWIPWDDAGGVRREVSLVPIFTASDGKIVVGEHSRHVLPGPTDLANESLPTKDAATSTKGPVQPVANFTDESESLAGSRGAQDPTGAATVQTTTIRIPPQVRRRLAAPPHPLPGNSRSE